MDQPTCVAQTHGEVHYVDASAILGGGQLHVFSVNRSLDDSALVQLDLADGEIAALLDGQVLTGISPQAANSFDDPDVVSARVFGEVKLADGEADASILSVVGLNAPTARSRPRSG